MGEGVLSRSEWGESLASLSASWRREGVANPMPDLGANLLEVPGRGLIDNVLKTMRRKVDSGC